MELYCRQKIFTKEREAKMDLIQDAKFVPFNQPKIAEANKIKCPMSGNQC